MVQWKVGVMSFQKIFGLCDLKGHIVEIRWDVTLEDNERTTECEDRARICNIKKTFFLGLWRDLLGLSNGLLGSLWLTS